MNRPISSDLSGRLNRRTLLRGAAGLSAAATLPWLAACTGSGEPGQPVVTGGGADTGTVTWWDQFRPLSATLENDLFTPYSQAHPGVQVERRELIGEALGQALQLGRRSQQLPDVHSLAGLDGTPAALVAAGWFQPIGDFVDFENTPVADQLIDGIHRFDGKVYSFPLFSGRWHDAIPWVNSAALEKADLGPDDAPKTWDQLRSVLRTLEQSGGGKNHGLVIAGKDTGYLGALVNRLAMTAGSPGEIDPATGRYQYGSQPYADAMEFLLSLQTDKVVHPSSGSMDTRDARSRWAAGEAAVYPWGPWFIGGLKVQEPESVERGLTSWHLPTPDGGAPVLYSPPPGGTFWVSSQAKLPKLGAQVMAAMLEPTFLTKLASAMDQPPIDAAVVAQADVDPAYKQMVEQMTSDVFIAPQPQVRNPDVSKVLAETRDVHPNVGEIAQALLSDSTTDYRKALGELDDKLTTERDRAIKAAVAKGAQVSTEDWVNSEWKPGQDAPQ